MSDIDDIISKIKGTHEAEIIAAVAEKYSNISEKQGIWYEKSEFLCPEACGECCRNFEPDLLECEALYMAAWLIQNQPEIAKEVAENRFPFPREKACQFWNEKAAYHCSIYGGRPFICRLFGACGNRGKSGETVFKPCKFYPVEKLAAYAPNLTHRQYSQSETEQIFGTLPPVMSDLMEGVVSLNPDNLETSLIREILPKTIQRLLWIISMTEM